MKIFVTGTRGIPDIPGGVERHCQELYPRIVEKGHEVFLSVRRSYADRKIDEYKGIRLVYCYAPIKKSFEAIAHTFISLLKARWYAPDLVHIHAIGPSFLTPLARLIGLKVVVTNHGQDYHRQKWGRLAKFVLKFGEKLGCIYANEIIVISSVIKEVVRTRGRHEANLIYNGVPIPEKSKASEFLDEIGAEPQKYILAVARFVPEKGLHDLIESFKSMTCDYKLIIAGDADHETAYSRALRHQAKDDHRIILTGYITGEPLRQIYSHARLFVLPSYHEGLPIALLEAMSYGLSVLVSDIPANSEVDLPHDRYFKCGDSVDLKDRMEALLKIQTTEAQNRKVRNQIREKYNWDRIAEQTIKVYRKVIIL